MPNFDSPLGNKKFATGNKLREMDIPDETGYSDTVTTTSTRNFGQQVPLNLDEIRNFQARSSDIQGEAQPSISRAEQEIKIAREARRTGKERLTDSARSRIELLLGMTRLEREVVISDDAVFVFQSLKSIEISEAYNEAAKYDNTVQSPFEIRRQLLARSLKSISGITFEQFIGSREIEDKLFFIDNSDHALLLRLYDEYLLMANELTEKYSIKNEADAKEVLEDIKK